MFPLTGSTYGISTTDDTMVLPVRLSQAKKDVSSTQSSSVLHKNRGLEFNYVVSGARSLTRRGLPYRTREILLAASWILTIGSGRQRAGNHGHYAKLGPRERMVLQSLPRMASAVQDCVTEGNRPLNWATTRWMHLISDCCSCVCTMR